MAQKTLIGGTAYEISGGTTLIDGTIYQIGGGRTLVDGTGYDISFSSGVLAKINKDNIAYSFYYDLVTVNGVDYAINKLSSPVEVYVNAGDVISTYRLIKTSYAQYYGVRVYKKDGTILANDNTGCYYDYTVPDNISAVNIYTTDASTSTYGLHILNFAES